MEETIRLTGVDIGYRDRRETKTVARGLSAVLQSGEMTCLLGANGVGKSTLLRSIHAMHGRFMISVWPK
ncbi:ATP-binding cassette domain-containing protein, partial [Segatella buccae]|uniref:ATP-binding cassette domain-containing protein n=1 Tax=Segatella buccae TaxID=28126 RepID=UPI0006616FF8